MKAENPEENYHSAYYREHREKLREYARNRYRASRGGEVRAYRKHGSDSASESTDSSNSSSNSSSSSRSMVSNYPEALENGGGALRFKLVAPNAKAPSRATPGSAGYDLSMSSMEAFQIENGETLTKCHTGVAFEIPKGHVGLLFPRSSICKKGLTLANSVGVIDSDYRGEISLVFRNETEGKFGYCVGERIGQLVVVPCLTPALCQVDELTETERGAGGYGSTGK